MPLIYNMSDIFRIGNYGFKLVGKKTMVDPEPTATRDRELKKKAPMVMYYVATYNQDGSPVFTYVNGNRRRPLVKESNIPLIFAVYMSESQMGFCRLASYKLGGKILINKGPDYAQSSLINFKLGNFILQNLNHPGIIEYPVTDQTGVVIGSPYPYLDTGSNQLIYHDYLDEYNVNDKARIKGVIAPASEQCGDMTPRISAYLAETSHTLQIQFPTMVSVEFVCNHAHSTSFANVEGKIFKVVLQSSSEPSRSIEIFVYKYTIASDSDGFAKFSGTIPVLIKQPNSSDPEDITEVGTYANYIPTYGAYVCKLFEYTIQLKSILEFQPKSEELTAKIIRVNDQYSFVGQLFDGLYPSSHLEEFLKSQGQRQGGAHQKKYKTTTNRRHRCRRRHNHKKSRKLSRKK